MRIKAYVGEKTPIYEMANGASESVGFIKANSFITLTGIKKDGRDSYYTTEEHDGFIKKTHDIKIVRDEEFYFKSSLLKKKQNRSKSNRYSEMKQNTAFNSGAWISNSSRPPLTVGGGFGGFQNSNSVTEGWQQTNSGGPLIPSYNKINISAASANSNVKQPTPMMAVAGIAGGFLGSKLGGNKLGGFATQALGSFASTGNWNGVNNMNLGGLFGGGTFGQLFNGATINNLMDGSFFNSIFSQNALSMISDILGSLMQKLDYIVGFNLSGQLLTLINGFAGFNIPGLSKNINSSNQYIPDRLINSSLQHDERIRKYFMYKGDSYKWSTYGGVVGGITTGIINYNKSYGLSSGNRNEDQVNIHKTQYNSLYSEFYESITKVRSSMNLNLTRNDWFYNFNRFRLLTPNSLLANSKGYIFFTRPDLNLISASAATSEVGLLINNMASQHPEIIAGLQKYPKVNGVAFDSGHKFIPILCNRCTGLDINDETLETKEIGDTYTGWKLNYGTTSIKSKTANTVTTSFIDDEKLSIYLTFKLWSEYISGVSRGVIAPFDEYIRQLQLDYAISIYYFLCAEDGESILFWTKFTGCIPTTIPSSNFSDNFETAIKQPKYSITWQYAFKNDYSIYTLGEFNHLCAANQDNSKALPMYDNETLRSAITLAGSPYVDTKTGGNVFKLHFRQAGNNFTPEY